MLRLTEFMIYKNFRMQAEYAYVSSSCCTVFLFFTFFSNSQALIYLHRRKSNQKCKKSDKELEMTTYVIRSFMVTPKQNMIEKTILNKLKQYTCLYQHKSIKLLASLVGNMVTEIYYRQKEEKQNFCQFTLKYQVVS